MVKYNTSGLDLSKNTLMSALLDYMGKPKGATAFMEEVKALTLEDRAWFTAQLREVGYKIPCCIAPFLLGAAAKR
jgi:hypothetical protein